MQIRNGFQVSLQDGGDRARGVGVTPATQRAAASIKHSSHAMGHWHHHHPQYSQPVPESRAPRVLQSSVAAWVYLKWDATAGSAASHAACSASLLSTLKIPPITAGLPSLFCGLLVSACSTTAVLGSLSNAAWPSRVQATCAAAKCLPQGASTQRGLPMTRLSCEPCYSNDHWWDSCSSRICARPSARARSP